MRNIPGPLQDHLDTGATTLCWCWRVTRTDGVRLGFTDHDRGLEFDGTTFEADAGFTASAFDDTLGLSVNSTDALGVLRSDQLREIDLAGGLYDNAVVEIWRVNWNDTSQRVLVRKGNIGEIEHGETAFKAETRGLAHVLNQPAGRIYQKQCDADLGDARCGIDLDDPAFNAAGAVLSAVADNAFTASGLGDFEAGFFAGGFLTWDSGPNTGLKSEVKTHVVSGGTAEISLWTAPVFAIAAGHDFTIRAGCDKTFETCRAKFDNIANFRGFPHMPGNDFVVATADAGDPDNDGQSMND